MNDMQEAEARLVSEYHARLAVRHAWAEGFKEGSGFRRVSLLGALGVGIGFGMCVMISLFAYYH